MKGELTKPEKLLLESIENGGRESIANNRLVWEYLEDKRKIGSERKRSKISKFLRIK